MEWDRQVLEHMGDLADYISLHRYVGNSNEDTLDYLAITNSIDCQIEEMDAVCRFIQARRRSKKRAYLCFDEWNVWYKSRHTDGEGKVAPHLIEEVYNLEDALVVAGFLHSFVRHADVLKIANVAQIVNVIAPILTRGDEMLVQSIFYPFEMFSKRRNGVSLHVALEGPSYESSSHGRVHYIDASAILGKNKLHLFFTNKSDNEEALIYVKVSDCDITALESGELLTGPDPKVANSFENPELIRVCPFKDMRIIDGQITCNLPPLSLVAMTVDL
jgi:alpha-N-arabinofuranosidase